MPGRCGCCTTRASSTIRPACCGRCATRPAAASRWTAGTERLAREAAEAGALARVSGAALRDELLDLLAEDEAPAAVGRLGELGIATAHATRRLRADGELVAARARGAPRPGADRALGALAALCSDGGGRRWVERLGLGGGGARARAARGRARPAAWREPRSRRRCGPRSCTRCCAASRPRRWRWRWRSAPRRNRCCASSPTCARPARDRRGRPAGRGRARVARDRARRSRRRCGASSTARCRGRDEELARRSTLARGERVIEVEPPGRARRLLHPPGRA